jgi:Glycosyl hydrolases family 39
MLAACSIALSACSSSSAPSSTTAAPSAVPNILAGPTVGVTNQVLGSAESNLAGLDWNTGNLSAVAPLRPPLVRIDAELGAISPRPGVIDTGPLLRKVATIRANGGVPLVIIDYLPARLGRPTVEASCPSCDPTLVAPQDWSAYDSLVRTVVRRLATAPQPAREFEVWNEPDLTFWNDTTARFLELAVHTHQDVATVASQTRLKLQVGGPAAAMFTADPTFIRNYVAAIEQANLPIDFVSFHWYANYPCLGPDHPESAAERGLWEKLKCSNPDLTPASYGTLIANVRAAVASAVPPGRPLPELFLDEWNMSAGGYDVRQDTNVGASFTLASLIDMEDAGLTRAYYYRAVKGLPTSPGDWGIATQTGGHLPAWSILDTWASLHGRRLGLAGSPPADVWIRAVRSGGSTSVLVANFSVQGATTQPLTLAFDPACTHSATVRTIDATHGSFDDTGTSSTGSAGHPVEVPSKGRLGLSLPPDSAVRVTTSCPPIQ